MFDSNKLKELRKNKGVSQVEISRYVNVSRSAYSMWESGTYTPNSKNIKLLAEYFNVDSSIFESHSEIINRYVKLNDINKTKLLKEAHNLYLSQLTQYKVHAKLSAGTGIFYYDEHDYDTVYSDKDLSYDIASWISGDSMMPDYKNGDVALIRANGFDYNGAVYAVVYDEETYIKKVFVDGNSVRLVSINKDYKDIVATIDEVRVVGSVINSFTPISEDI